MLWPLQAITPSPCSSWIQLLVDPSGCFSMKTTPRKAPTNHVAWSEKRSIDGSGHRKICGRLSRLSFWFAKFQQLQRFHPVPAWHLGQTRIPGRNKHFSLWSSNVSLRSFTVFCRSKMFKNIDHKTQRVLIGEAVDTRICKYGTLSLRRPPGTWHLLLLPQLFDMLQYVCHLFKLSKHVF